MWMQRLITDSFPVRCDNDNYCAAHSLIHSTHTDGKKLKLVQGITMIMCAKFLILFSVMTRHGDRTPDSLIPSDNTVWDCTLNNLFTPTSVHEHVDSTKPHPLPPRFYRKLYLPNREFLPGNCARGTRTCTTYTQCTRARARTHTLATRTRAQ